MGGSIGCDVCGKNRDRRGWLVVPPNERINKRLQLHVALEDTAPQPAQQWTQSQSTFDVALPANASALSIELPAPPRGTRYLTNTLRVGGL